MMSRNLRITRIISRTGEVAVQLHRLQFSEFRPPTETWGPAVNVIGYPERLEICVDLAGVDKEDLEVQVEGRRLRIYGVRSRLDAGCAASGCCRVLMMEIDDGPFERILELPVAIDAQKVSAHQENGILRIVVPVIG